MTDDEYQKMLQEFARMRAALCDATDRMALTLAQQKATLARLDALLVRMGTRAGK